MRIVFALLFLSPWLIFSQGNYNFENFGNKSLLLSGNVTGSVDDLGLTYYNPARIALVENPIFAINAKGYQLNQYAITNAFGLEETIRSSNFQGVPSTVAGTFEIKKWPNHHFAYSFISRSRNNLNINYSNEYFDPTLSNRYESNVSDIEIRNKVNDEWFGLTWGMALKDNLSIGTSVFFSVYSNSASNNIRHAGLQVDQSVDLYNNEVSYGQNSYGLFFKLGLAYKLPKIDLGVNIDLPYWEFVSSGRFSYQEFNAGDPSDPVFEYYKYSDLDAQRKEPLGISVGAGIPFKRSKLHFKIDWHNGVPLYDRVLIPGVYDPNTGVSRFQFVEERKSVWNFGLGGEFFINDTYRAFASFSTDYSAIDKNANIFDVDENLARDVNLAASYVHVASGVDLSLKWGHMVLGATFSSGNSVIPNEEIPQHNNLEISNNTSVKYTRWRFIVGLEIPIFNYNFKFD